MTDLEIAEHIIESSSSNIVLNSRLTLTTLPSNIPEILNGSFSCCDNKLTSLKNSPRIVKGSFFCSFNQLTSLEGSPKIVEGAFLCAGNNLSNLDGAPKVIKGSLYCRYNKSDDFHVKWVPPFIKDEIFFDYQSSSLNLSTLKRNSLQKEKTQWTKI